MPWGGAGDAVEGAAEERERFLALNDRVFSLYGEGRIGEALGAVDAETPALPGWRSRTGYWKACLLTLPGASRRGHGHAPRPGRSSRWWQRSLIPISWRAPPGMPRTEASAAGS